MTEELLRCLVTARLLIRPVQESDRERFVGLFGDASFMVFSESGALDRQAGERRFDRMLALAEELPFCKQAVIEAATGNIVGFVGADHVDYHDEPRLELGYRLVEETRGRGYATEAAQAILDMAGKTFHGELLAFIDPLNHPSRNVLRKLGFSYVEKVVSSGQVSEVYRLQVRASP